MKKSILISSLLILTTIGATTYYIAGRKCTGSKRVLIKINVHLKSCANVIEIAQKS